jgi:pilus assembly protein CpaE
MVAETEARLLWTTYAAPGSPEREQVAKTAADLGMAATICAHRELFEIIRPGRFDLVGIEIGLETRDGLGLVRQLHERFPRLGIVAALTDGSIATLRTALEAGASDIIALPLNQQELNKTLLKFRQTRVRETNGKGTSGEVISVYGVRGGLGTTTIAVNLAAQLAALDAGNVALVDLDLQRGDVATFLNLNPMESLAAIASAPGEVDEIFLHGMLARHASNISVLPAPQHIEEGDAVGHDEVKLALGLLRMQFRYTVVDTPRTITGAVVPAFENADRVLIVTDLCIPSMRAARRVIDLLERLGVSADHLDVVLTQIVDGPVDAREVGKSLGKEPLLTIPRDAAAASTAMNTGVPIGSARPGALASAMAELAAKVARVEPGARGRRGSFLRRIFAKEATS